MRLVATLLFVVACSQPESPLRAPRSGHMEHEMSNCPNALPGANTSLGLTSDGVDLTITAVMPETQARIKTLAAEHSERGAPGGAMMHTGQHGGPGMMGHCPVIHFDTIVTSTPLPDGAIIHIRATASVEAVQREVTSRVAALQKRAEAL